MVNQVQASKVATALAPLCQLYGTPKDAQLNIYVRVLGDYTAEQLDKAVDVVLSTYTQKTFPAPAVIKKTCDELPVDRSSKDRISIAGDSSPVQYDEAGEVALGTSVGQEALREALGVYIFDRAKRTGEVPDYTWLEEARGLFKNHMQMVSQLSWAATMPSEQADEGVIRERSGEYADMDKLMAQACLAFARAVEHREHVLYDRYYTGHDKKPPANTTAGTRSPVNSAQPSQQNQ